MLDDLTLIARDVFDNSAIVLNENSSANDIEEWDSISHIYFIVEIEKHFNVKFFAQEIANFANVGEIMAAITQRKNQR